MVSQDIDHAKCVISMPGWVRCREWLIFFYSGAYNVTKTVLDLNYLYLNVS